MRIIILMIGVFFISCQSEVKDANTITTPIKKTIADLQKEVSENPTKESRGALANAFLDEIKSDPKNPKNSIFFHNAINLFVQNGSLNRASNLLKQTIHNNYASEDTQNDILQLASVSKKMEKPLYAKTIYSAFLSAFPDTPNKDEVKKKLDGGFGIESALKNMVEGMSDAKTNKVNPDVAKDYMELCSLNALVNPNDVKNARFLHKGAEVALALRMFPKAIQYYEWIRQKYSDSPEAPKALFMEAFTFDEKIKDKDKARKLYKLFLDQYPKDEFADDTQFLLENLDKSNEDIIRKFGDK